MSTIQRRVSLALVLAVCIASGSGQGLPQPKVPAFPALPRPGANPAVYQALAPSTADAAGMAPSYADVQVREAHWVCQNMTAHTGGLARQPFASQVGNCKCSQTSGGQGKLHRVCADLDI